MLRVMIVYNTVVVIVEDSFEVQTYTTLII